LSQERERRRRAGKPAGPKRCDGDPGQQAAQGLAQFGGSFPDSATAGIGRGGFDPGQRGGMGNGGPGLNDYDASLVTWLQARRGGAKFLFATFGAMSAAPYITATGESVLPIGGFDGADPSPTLAQLKEWVSSGDLRYVLSGGQGGGPQGGSAGSSEIRQWVEAHCTAVTDAPVSNLLRCAAA